MSSKFWQLYEQVEIAIKEFPELAKLKLPRIAVVGSQVISIIILIKLY